MKKKKLLSITILLMFAIFSLWQCAPEEKPEDKPSLQEENHEEEQIVTISPEEMKEFGVELAKAGAGNLQLHVNLPGEIVIPPDNLAHIHPRFPGIVKKVLKHIGEHVKKGETLAIVESNESLVEYQIKSLIDGTIVEKHLTLGEVVTDRNHGFLIANLNTVWVYLQVYQKDLPYVKEGQKVVIFAGPGLPRVEGVIDYISPIIDEVTRTAKARVVLPNPKGIWKPGLFVTGRIITKDLQVDVLVPKTALQTLADETVIFVKTDEGFEPRPVEIGKENEENVEIIHGLNPGEIYVRKGGFTLKAELLKSEFGDGHGH
ncbi:efflux RND transporter periplasmic adaptor subunit [Calditrichota bacterium GD2]